MERRILEEKFSFFSPEQANAVEANSFDGDDAWQGIVTVEKVFGRVVWRCKRSLEWYIHDASSLPGHSNRSPDWN